MNLLFHGREFPPQASGVGTYFRLMAEGLARLGHGTVVVTSRMAGLPEQEDTPYGRVYRLYEAGASRGAAVRDLVLELARRHRCDWIEGADHLGEVAPLLDVAGRPPVTVRIHGSNPIRVLREADILYPWQRATLGLALLRHRVQVRAERRAIEGADCVSTPSERMLQELRRQGLRLPPRAAVIPNPIAPAAPAAEQDEASVPTALFPARLVIGKGVPYLDGIVRSVVRQFPDFVLEIAGEDSYARGLGSLRKWLEGRLGPLAGHVRFLGRLSPDELDRAYRRAWVTVLPTRWDNFPMSLLESMALGKAAVTTPHGGMPEMLDGTDCPLAPPDSPEFAERLCELLAEPRRRWAAGASARRKVERCYRPEVVVPQYVAFLSSVH